MTSIDIEDKHNTIPEINEEEQIQIETIIPEKPKTHRNKYEISLESLQN